MPVNKLIAAKKRAIASLDVNGDGVIDHHDAIAAAKITGAAVAGLGVTAIASASVGSTIVASGATAIAAKVTALTGAAAGGFIAATLGPVTTTVSLTMSILSLGPSTLVLVSTAVTSAVSTKLLAISAGAGAIAAQAANGVVAGFPVIQSIALSNAIAANEVVMIAGIPMAVNAALAAGLIAIVIVGGYAYYLLTKDRITSEGQLLPTPA